MPITHLYEDETDFSQYFSFHINAYNEDQDYCSFDATDIVRYGLYGVSKEDSCSWLLMEAPPSDLQELHNLLDGLGRQYVVPITFWRSTSPHFPDYHQRHEGGYSIVYDYTPNEPVNRFHIRIYDTEDNVFRHDFVDGYEALDYYHRQWRDLLPEPAKRPIGAWADYSYTTEPEAIFTGYVSFSEGYVEETDSDEFGVDDESIFFYARSEQELINLMQHTAADFIVHSYTLVFDTQEALEPIHKKVEPVMFKPRDLTPQKSLELRVISVPLGALEDEINLARSRIRAADSDKINIAKEIEEKEIDLEESDSDDGGATLVDIDRDLYRLKLRLEDCDKTAKIWETRLAEMLEKAAPLQAVKNKIVQAGAWGYRTVLMHESDLLYYLNKGLSDLGHPQAFILNHVDWSAAVKEWQKTLTSIEYEGVQYWVKRCD